MAHENDGRKSILHIIRHFTKFNLKSASQKTTTTPTIPIMTQTEKGKRFI